LPSRGAFRRANSIPDTASLVLVLARLARIKDLPTFLQAVALSDGMHAVVAGPDEHDGTRPQLEREIKRLGIGDRVRINPAGVWGRAKAEALADADAVCLPSAYESFGSAAAEAAAVGVPVIVTDRCGVKDVLDPQSSRVVPAEHPELLAAALAEALTLQPEAREAAGSVRRRLDWTILAGEQAAMYERLRA
jgi:glycosyltransferase involved in cell wall biosynthesis